MPSHVLVLTGPSNQHAIDETIANIAVQALAATGRPQQPKWLRHGKALELSAELPVDPERIKAVTENLRDALADRPIDVNLLENIGTQRRKRLLVADMDSTIIQQECIDEIAAAAGIGQRVSEITERAMRGELDFEAALTERVGLLAVLNESVLQDVYDARIKLMPGAGTLVRTMSAHGAYCALVSGGFTFFTSRVANRVGFHENRANRLTFADGRLSGEVARPILGRSAKLETLQALAARNALEMADCLAVGDGANDLAMIRAAGLGVAYRAKPVVASEARANITYGDLTALLYLQGFSFDEFSDPI
jgi:phosphoserine phosphatase